VNFFYIFIPKNWNTKSNQETSLGFFLFSFQTKGEHGQHRWLSVDALLGNRVICLDVR